MISLITWSFRSKQKQDKNKEQPETSQSANRCHPSPQQTGSDTSGGIVRESNQGSQLCQAADEEQPPGFRCHDCDGAISVSRCRWIKTHAHYIYFETQHVMILMSKYPNQIHIIYLFFLL